MHWLINYRRHYAIGRLFQNSEVYSKYYARYFRENFVFCLLILFSSKISATDNHNCGQPRLTKQHRTDQTGVAHITTMNYQETRWTTCEIGDLRFEIGDSRSEIWETTMNSSLNMAIVCWMLNSPAVLSLVYAGHKRYLMLTGAKLAVGLFATVIYKIPFDC